MTTVATPPAGTSSPTLTWQMVHAEPGALVYSIPGVNSATNPLVRRTVGHTGGSWSPEGAPAAHGEPVKHSALHYAEYIGRVGVLAAALGVGAAVAGTPGIAWAEPTAQDTTISTSSTTESDNSTDTTAVENSATTSEASPAETESADAEAEEAEADSEAAEAEAESTSPTETEDTPDGAETPTDETSNEETAPTVEATTDPGVTPPTPAQTIPAAEDADLTEAPTAETPAAETPTEEAPAEPATTPIAEPRNDTPTTTGDTNELNAPTPTPVMQTPAPLPELTITSDTETPTLTPAEATTTAESKVASPAAAPESPASLATVNHVLDTVLAPLTAPATPAAQAAQTPLLWGVFAWVRRTFFNSHPTLGYDPTTTSQTDNTIIGAVTVTDRDGDTVTLSASTPINGGAVVVNSDGTFIYTASTELADTGGTDTFTLTATDAHTYPHLHGLRGLLNIISFGLIGPGHTGDTTITLDIAATNTAPIPATPAYTLGTTQPSTGAVPGELHITDPDLDTLTYTVTGGPANGAISLDAATGAFSYTPTPTARHHAAATPLIDIDNFAVTVDDGHGGLLTVPVTVTIDPTNTPPTITGLTVSDPNRATGAVNVTVTVTDSDTDPITYIVIHDPSYGTLAPSPGGLTYTPTEEARHAAAFTPGPDTDTFQLAASDLHGGITSPESVTVEIGPENSVPVAVGDNVTTVEDTPVTGNVLTNDTDIEGTTLTAALVGNPTHGTVNLGTTGSFTYTPAANYNGTDSFTYRASDGIASSNLATVSVTVTAINDAPIAVGDNITTTEDTPVTGNVLTNDTDVEGTTLTATLVGNPTHGTVNLNTNGSFTYTPAANYNGTDTFTYRASDGTLTSNLATVTVTVTAVNEAPVAVGDTVTTVEDTPVTGNVLTNDTDVEGTTLTATLVGNPTHGTVNLNTNGSFTYTPTANYNGTDSFTYRASDGISSSNLATVSVTVTAVNDAPIAVGDTITTIEDTPVTGNMLTNDTDIDSPTLTAILGTGPTHGTVNLNTNGSFTYTPAANYNGTDSFTYTASDGANTSNTATVAITVTAANDTPIAVGDNITTTEDTPVTGNVLTNDTDIDSPTLTAVLVGNPTHGTVNLNTNGSFTYTPAANYNGTDTFTYRASDATLTSNLATVSVTITAVNDVPIALGDSITTTEDTPVTGNVVTNDTDVEGTTLTATLVGNPTHGTVNLGTNGGFTYTPATNYNGTDTFTYRASDGISSSNLATVTVTVTAVNDAPIASITSPGAADPATGKVTVTLTASDPDGDPLSITNTAPAQGVVDVVNNGNGTWSLTYAPTDAARLNAALIPTAVTDDFTVNVSDTHGGTTPVIVSAVPVTRGYFTPIGTYPVGDPVPGGTFIGLEINGNTGYIIKQSERIVIPVDPATMTPTGAPIAVGNEPSDAAFSGKYLYVTNSNGGGAGTVTVIDTTTNSIHTTIPVGNGPIGVDVAGNHLYVSNAIDGTVTVIDTTTNQVVGSPISVGQSPIGVVSSADGGFVYVIASDDDAVWVINTDTNAVVDTNPDIAGIQPISVGHSASLGAVSGTRLYVANSVDNTVSVIDTTANAIVDTVAVGRGPYFADASADGSLVYVGNFFDGTVSVIDTTTNTVIDTNSVLPGIQALGVGNWPGSVAAHGSRLAIGNMGDTTVSVFAITGTMPVNHAPVASVTTDGAADPATGEVAMTLTASDADGGPLSVTTTAPASGTIDVLNNHNGTWTLTYTPTAAARLSAALSPTAVTDNFTVTVSDTHGAATPVDVAAPVARGYFSAIATLPLGDPDGATTIVLSPDGNTGFILRQSDHTVTKVDLATNTAIGNPIDAGNEPRGMAVAGNYLYVANAIHGGAGTVTVFDTRTDTVLTTVTVDNGPAMMTLSTDGSRLYVANVESDTVSVIDTGTNTRIDTIAVGHGPISVAAKGNRLYVANVNADTVSVIDTTINAVVATVDVGSYPGRVTVSGNHVYVNTVDLRSGDLRGIVTVIDIATNAVVKTIDVGLSVGEEALMVSPDGSLVYVTNMRTNTVTVIDTATSTVLDTNPALADVQALNVDQHPIFLAVHGNRLYVGNYSNTTVSVFDITDNAPPSSIATVDTADPTTGVVTGSLNATDPEGDPLTYTVTQVANQGVVTLLGDGMFTYTPNQSARLNAARNPAAVTDGFTVTVSDAHGGTTPVAVAVPVTPGYFSTVATLPVGDSVDAGTNIWLAVDGNTGYILKRSDHTVTKVDLATNTPVGLPIDVGSEAGGVAATGHHLYVATPVNGTITVIDTNDTIIKTIDVDSLPGVMAVSTDGSRLYVGHYFSGTVSVIDTASNTRIDTIAVGTGPAGIAADGNRVYVANANDNTVSVINTPTNTVIATVDVGSHPVGVAVSGNQVYVANLDDDSVSVIDASTHTVVTTINLNPGHGFHAMVAVSPDGSLVYVTRTYGGVVTVIDTATNTVIDTHPGVPGYQGLVVGETPDAMAVHGTRLYVGNCGDTTVSVIDITDNVPPTAAATFGTADPTTGVVTGSLNATDPEGDPLTYVAQEANHGIVALSSNGTFTYTPTAAARLNAALNPTAVADGFFVTVSDAHGGNTLMAVTAIPVTPGYFAAVATFPVGEPVDGFMNIVPAVNGNTGYILKQSDNTVTKVDLATNTPIGAPIDIGGDMRTGVAATSHYLYIGNHVAGAAGTVTVVDTNTDSVVASIPVDEGPSYMTVNDDGSRLYVANYFSGTVSVIGTTSNERIGTVAAGNGPYGITASGNRVYVTNADDGTVTVINTTNDTAIATVDVGVYPIGVGVSGNHVYVANLQDNSVSVIDTTTNTVADTIHLVFAGASDVAVSPDGSLVYVVSTSDNAVEVIDTATDTLIDTNPGVPGIQALDVGQYPQFLAVHGSRLYVGNSGDTTVSIVEIAGDGSAL